MTIPSGKYWGTDVLRVVAFPLVDSGTLRGGFDVPYATPADTMYEGLDFLGPKSFEPAGRAPRSIVNVSQGRVRDTIYLPSNEALTFTLHCSYDDLAVSAALMNVEESEMAEAKVVYYHGDKEGKEIQVAMFATQLVTHDEDGLQVWHSYVVPRARAIPAMPTFAEAATDKIFNISASNATKNILGETLTDVSDGCTESAVADVLTEGVPSFGAWLADGVETVFNFPTGKFPTASAKVLVINFATGAAIAGAVNTTLGTFTPSVMPALGVLMMCKWEYDE